ncbi:hypothetical protein C8Q77DRAFT_1100762 [Trametes polyzona]|nr:hypothetical protein C8Q77DRAFT_1100762 [Trametes polyzona]
MSMLPSRASPARDLSDVPEIRRSTEEHFGRPRWLSFRVNETLPVSRAQAPRRL